MKPTNPVTRTRHAAVVLVAACLSAAAWAKSADQKAPTENQKKMQAIAESTKQNAQLLKQYSWTMRTEITQKGEVKGVRLDKVRFDIDGKPQLTALSGPPETAEAPGIRPRAKRRRQEIIDNKLEDKQAHLQRLIALSNQYLTPSQTGIQKLFRTGQFWQGTGPTDPVIRIEVSHLVKPGDELTLTIDPKTRKPRQARIATNLDGNPVSVVADYRILPNGPSYVARTLIQSPKDEMQIKIENFDYVRQGASPQAFSATAPQSASSVLASLWQVGFPPILYAVSPKAAPALLSVSTAHTPAAVRSFDLACSGAGCGMHLHRSEPASVTESGEQG